MWFIIGNLNITACTATIYVYIFNTVSKYY